MTLIILEGPDCCGKTTLAQTYIDKGYKYFHCSYDKVVDQFKLQQNTVKKATRHPDAIIDRLHVSEYVYGKVFRGGDFGAENFRTIQQMVQNATHIMCLPPRDVFIKTFTGLVDAQYYKQVDKMMEVYDLYQHIASYNMFATYRMYDWTQNKE